MTDAAGRGDAVAADDRLTEQLGPVPVADQPNKQPRTRSHHKAKAPAAQPPAIEELVKWLKPTLGLTTMLAGLLLAGMNLEDPLVDVVMLAEDEAEDISKPLARILARQSWYSRYGHDLIASSDWIDLSWALALYAARVYPAVRQRQRDHGERRRHERHQQNAGVSASGPANGRASGNPADWPSVGGVGLGGAYTVDN